MADYSTATHWLRANEIMAACLELAADGKAKEMRMLFSKSKRPEIESALLLLAGHHAGTVRQASVEVAGSYDEYVKLLRSSGRVLAYRHALKARPSQEALSAALARLMPPIEKEEAQ
ncbi:MAG: hypothetical protein IT195_12545 [Microthrixaceae bacterium]|nr:hypothetical protein [Microthrixaceae bacterium]